MQRPTPTLYQIISTDTLAQNFFVMIFGGWVIYAIDSLFEGHGTFLLLILSVFLTSIGLLAFYWRYQTIVSTFALGQEIIGRVVDIQTISLGKSVQDYVIDYEYNFHGQVYQSRNRVKRNDVARSLKPWQPITLMVNENNPKTAFIKDMYLVYL